MQQITLNFIQGSVPVLLLLLRKASCWAQRLRSLPWWTLPSWGALTQMPELCCELYTLRKENQRHNQDFGSCSSTTVRSDHRINDTSVNAKTAKVREKKKSPGVGKWRWEWCKGHGTHTVEVRTRLQMSPERLAYCLVSSPLAQATWWPDLSGSGSSRQCPSLGESS